MTNEITSENGALVTSNEVGAVSAVAREQSEIAAAVGSAKRYPRNETAAFLAAVKAFERPAMAESAQYKYPRGKTEVSGPSVYLARQLARAWGNLRYGMRVVSCDEQYTHIKGYALDLETNAYVEHEDKFRNLVQRKVWKDGVSETKWVTPDERDLRELINKRGAIAMRNAILQIVPPDLIDDAIARAEQTLRKVAARDLSTNRADTVKALVVEFDKLAITIEMIEKRLGHKLDAISEDELANLRQVYKSIRDGEATREDHFDYKAPIEPRTIQKSKPRTEWCYDLRKIESNDERDAVLKLLQTNRADWDDTRSVWVATAEIKRAVNALVEEAPKNE